MSVLNSRQLFNEPVFLEKPYSWVQHIPFAFFLVETMKPHIVVELGTHSGNSYFAFCQAVKNMALHTKCFAVDTWEGDEHSLYYGKEVYQRVKRINQKEFDRFSFLQKMTFDEALPYHKEKSIDVLHIDGLHTYEAVKHDFESWFPKVSDKGVVIFHDTLIKDRGFGVGTYFDEIKHDYPHLEFTHGNGLGFICPGKTPDPTLTDFMANAQKDPLLLNVFASLGKKIQLKQENTDAARELFVIRKEVLQLKESINRLQDSEEEQNKTIQNYHQKAIELEDSIEQKVQALKDLNAQVAALNEKTEKYKSTIQKNEQEINLLLQKINHAENDKHKLVNERSAKNQEVETLKNHQEKLEDFIQNQSLWLKEKEQKIKDLSLWLTEKQEKKQELGLVLTKKEEQNQELSHSLNNEKKLTQTLKANLETIQEELHKVHAINHQQRQELQKYNKNISRLQQQRTGQNQLISQLQQNNKKQKTLIDQNEKKIIELQKENHRLKTLKNNFLGRLAWAIKFEKWHIRSFRALMWPLKMCWYLISLQWRKIRLEFQCLKHKKTITGSRFFNAAWYLKTYPDVQSSGVNPAFHYLKRGAREGRDPSPDFSTQFYLKQNEDVKSKHINPLVHYILFGEREGRKISPSHAQPNTELRTFDKETPGKSFGSESLNQIKIKGFIDTQRSSQEMVVSGWLASMQDPAAREVTLQIGNNYSVSIFANMYRAKLQQKGIHKGRHGFKLSVPGIFANGKDFLVKLLDKETGLLIAKKTYKWEQPQKNYSDFSEYLAHSYCSPYVYAPFSETDKRCFASMEGVATHLCSVSQKHLEQNANPVKFSVIMPAFNREKTIEHAIDSVLNQTYPNFELIIIDDCSTDQTVQVIESYDDKRIKLLKNTQNAGVSKTRNIGLENATGQYIAYLDTDNTWDIRYLSAMHGAVCSVDNPDCLYCGQIVFKGKEKQLHGVRFGMFNKSLLLNRNYIDLNCFVHHKSTLQNIIGFDTQLSRYVDWDLMARLSEKYNFYAVPVLLSNYYLDLADNSITGNHKLSIHLETVRNRFQVMRKKAFDFHDENERLQNGISIVIPSYEALEDLKICIDAIVPHFRSEKVELIVVDNCSQVEVRNYLRKLGDQHKKYVKILLMDSNFGFTYAVNKGISLANPHNDIVLLNNDAILGKSALHRLQKTAYLNDEYALTIPAQILPGGTKTINAHVPFANPNFDCDVNISVHHKNLHRPPLLSNGKLLELSFAPFFCVFIKNSILKQQPELDAIHGRHYRSDRLYCNYVTHVLQKKIIFVPDALVYHKLQKSTETLKSKNHKDGAYNIIFQQNKWTPQECAEFGIQQPAWL